MKVWDGLVVGGAVMYHFAYFLLSLELVSHSYVMLYGFMCVSLGGLDGMYQLGNICTFYSFMENLWGGLFGSISMMGTPGVGAGVIEVSF